MANGTLKVSNIETSSGSGTITLGQSGETVTIPSGCTITNSGTATGFGGGKVLQVVQATDTSARTTTSNSYVTASNTLSVNITPSSTSSKILVVLMLCGFGADTQSTNARVTVKRDTSTDISPSNGFADNNVTAGGSYYVGGGNSVLDSPNTTSQVNYQLYIQNTGGSHTARLNNGGFSSLTCFEIGA